MGLFWNFLCISCRGKQLPYLKASVFNFALASATDPFGIVKKVLSYNDFG